MMKNNKRASKAANAQAGTTYTTTTEELIVQYLDGELIRKELETVLFDRLAQSEEARALLREYLVVRGAIRQSASDERFQLSHDLDGRTRARIEQMFERISAEGFDVVFPATGVEHAPEFLPDRAAIATDPFARRLKQWSVRTSFAMLALLLAIGTTWYVTHSSDDHAVKQIAERSQQAAMSTPNIDQVPPAPSVTAMASHENVLTEPTHIEHARAARTSSEGSMTEANPSHAAVGTQPPAPVAQPVQDVMITDRFGKAIESAKHEVVISSRDRL